MKLTADEQPLYADAVWETFRDAFDIRRLTVSSAEGFLILKWIKRNLPLPIVERGIRQTGGKPRTLLACERSVEESVSYWHSAMGGLP